MLPRRSASRSAYRRLIESLRVMLAIIAGLLMLDARPALPPGLSIAVGCFSVYASVLLWLAANGTANVQRRLFYWIDALWFLLMLWLSGEGRTHYFLFLFFPVFFAAWRTGYRESIIIATFSGFASLAIFALREPHLPWMQIIALPLSLFVVGPMFVGLARMEVLTQKNQALAASMVERLNPRRGFDSIVHDVLEQIAVHLDASVAIFVLRPFGGKCRIFCWEENEGASELPHEVAVLLADHALALPADAAAGWSGERHWWNCNRQFELDPSGEPADPGASDRETLVALNDLIGRGRLVTVPLGVMGVGRMRLILAGEGVRVSVQLLDRLQLIVEHLGPSLENAYLREQLAAEAADAERARIGRDLHDSAIQPYIGLKYAVEAVQRRAGPNNPVAEDLERLVEMVTEELMTMRDVVSGLRGELGKGGALLSSAVQRQAARFGQLFGIDVKVDIEGDMPVSRRMAGELFHIVSEGLSNIRRHTGARRAWIALRVCKGQLVISIRNENDANVPLDLDFTPRSLTERAADLGGSVDIKRDRAITTVTVRVPMPAAKSGKTSS
ncbi:sensor histidine kinase [Propionivibrio limicola]|uniref:sensor histidine kinase n=1 Tax=Propionivibrio limicola TaxID=167645 RepID=UPI0012927552|nr:histidine kinase [Propionivibrio limicola]